MTDAEPAPHASAIDAYGRAEAPEAYAGIWVDREADVVVALFARDAGAHDRALRAQLGPDARLRVEPATFPLRVLEGVRERVSSDRPALRELGLAIVGLSVDVRLNRVAVGLSEPTPAAAELLQHRYGDAVVLRPDRARAEPR